MAAAFDKIVVVTQRTALEELIERFNNRAQARFYVQQLQAKEAPKAAPGRPAPPRPKNIEEEAAHDAYKKALASLTAALPAGVPHQFVERSFLPNFLFGDGDLVIALGRDGLVVNIAKYLKDQPLLGVNPDPTRIDGVLVRFPVPQAAAALPRLLAGEVRVERITMAKAALSDGQTLHAVNDFFIGQRTHVSARYRLAFRGQEEEQSSSGVIVSTGAGSTGWHRSVLAGALGTAASFTGQDKLKAKREEYAFSREAEQLRFSVREPFASMTTGAELVYGRIKAGEELVVTSKMPQNGVIFSDGIEADALAFGSGMVARIGVAERKVRLIAPRTASPA